MTVEDLFERAIRGGMSSDPRGRDGVLSHLRRERRRYEQASHQEQAEFDTERLQHPYADSRILTGNPETEVRRALVGIDIHSSEVLLAAELGRQGKQIDLLIAHHPEGKALAALDQVMELQTEVFAAQGVPINVADHLMRPRMAQVARGISPENHYQAVDAAALLNFPMVCLHTPADNKAWRYVQLVLDRRSPDNVAEVVDLIKSIPEYKHAAERGAKVQVVAGSSEARAGRVVALEFTGGTNASKEVYEHLARAGVGTIVSMHMKEEHREEAEKHHINVVVAPHMASDSLGMNLLLDEFNQAGIEIIPCSGFIRVERKRRGRRPGQKNGEKA